MYVLFILCLGIGELYMKSKIHFFVFYVYIAQMYVHQPTQLSLISLSLKTLHFYSMDKHGLEVILHLDTLLV